MFTMIRRLLLALGVGTLLVLFGANTAFAADQPPADTKLVYQPGSSANVLMLSSNLSAAQQRQIDTYIIRVQIMNQPPRVLTVNKLPATLFNIIPGTRVHAYLTVKGDFGTSREFDSGEYIQGEGSTTAPSATQSPTATPSSTPSATRSQPTPSATASSTPSSAASPAPVATSQPSSQPVESVSQQHTIVGFLDAHLLPIGIIAGITFVLLGVLVLLRRRRG